jgi:hypothetical protein
MAARRRAIGNRERRGDAAAPPPLSRIARFSAKACPVLDTGWYRFAEEKRANKREESEVPIQQVGNSL